MQPVGNGQSFFGNKFFPNRSDDELSSFFVNETVSTRRAQTAPATARCSQRPTDDQRTHNHTGTRSLTFSINEPSFGVVQLALSKTTACFVPLSDLSKQFLRFTRSKLLVSEQIECSNDSQISLKRSDIGHTRKANDSR